MLSPRHPILIGLVLFVMFTLWITGRGLAQSSLVGTSAIGDREALPVVSWEEARQVVRQLAIVAGKVEQVGGTRNIEFLNFSRTDRAAFKVVVFAHAWSNFPGKLKDLYEGKLVEVRGHVTLFEGNPQIVVSKPEQIRVVEKLPEKYLPVVPVRKHSGSEVVLATFNVCNLFDAVDDPYANDETTPEKPRKQLEALAAAIQAVDADVLALQEIESRGYLKRFLEVFLPEMGYQHIVLVEGNDMRGIDVALVSRIPLGTVHSHAATRFDPAMSHNATDRFQRDLLCVEVRPAGDDPWEVWVVHLKSKGGDEDTEPIRLAEARFIRKLADERLADNPRAQFLICGDFNDEFASRPLQTIVGADGNRLKHLFDGVPAADRITFNEEPYRSMIDFIICSPAMADRFVPNSYRIWPGSLETTGSDHNPVSCKFRLRNGTANKPLAPQDRESLAVDSASSVN